MKVAISFLTLFLLWNHHLLAAECSKDTVRGLVVKRGGIVQVTVDYAKETLEYSKESWKKNKKKEVLANLSTYFKYMKGLYSDEQTGLGDLQKNLNGCLEAEKLKASCAWYKSGNEMQQMIDSLKKTAQENESKSSKIYLENSDFTKIYMKSSKDDLSTYFINTIEHINKFKTRDGGAYSNYEKLRKHLEFCF